MDKNFNFAEERYKRLFSLDALDLCLLPIPHQPWIGEPNLLWRRKPLLPEGKEYYEFIITSLTDDDSTKNTETICYVCNTFVPKTYISEHLNSSKHASYQKIIETALDRAAKHKLIGKDEIKNNLEYFCEHCVSVIHTCNKNEHEKSKTHKTLAVFDEFISNFAFIYTNINPIDVIDNKVKDIQDDSNDINPTDVIDNKVKDIQDDSNDITLLKVNPNIDEGDLRDINELASFEILVKDVAGLVENVSEIKNKSQNDLVSAIEACADKKDKEMNNNEPTNDVKTDDVKINDVHNETVEKDNSLEKYIEKLKRYGTVKISKSDLFDQDHIRIETSDGAELIVSAFNFHGLKKIGKYFQCKLCKSVFENVIDHRILEQHMEIVAQPLEDKHCMRRLQDNSKHCVVCNKIIENRNIHTQFNKHLNKLTRALAIVPKRDSETITESTKVSVKTVKQKKASTESPKANETEGNVSIKQISESLYYCLTCDAQIHASGIESHLTASNHVANSKSIYYLMNKSESNLLTCKVCHVNINYQTYAVEEHIASTFHFENYNSWLSKNMIDKTITGFFCKPCGKGLFRTGELSHIEKASHKEKLDAYNANNDESRFIKSFVGKYPSVNEVNEKVTTAPIKEVNDVNEKATSTSDNVKNTLNTEKTELNQSDSEKLTDKSNNEVLLNRKVENNETSEINDSNFKVNNDKPKIDELITKVNDLIESLLKYFKNAKEIHSHFQITDTDDVLRCKICSDKVMIDDIEKHTNSLRHIRNYRDFVYANKLIYKKDRYLCYICNADVEIGRELWHLESSEHEKRLDAIHNGDYVLITIDNRKLIDKIHDDLKVINDESYSNEINETSDEFNDFTNVKYHFCDLIDNKKQLICVLCREIVENKEYEYWQHATETRHETYYEKLLTYNRLFALKDGFVCGFCECITENNEFLHISSEKHIANQLKDPKKNYCSTCKVTTDLGLKDHFTSESHIKNVGPPDHIHCYICNVQIANNPVEIQRHNKCFDHFNISSLIDENNIVLENKNCVCQVCELTFGRDGLKDHIGSLNHIMLLHHFQYFPTGHR